MHLGIANVRKKLFHFESQNRKGNQRRHKKENVAKAKGKNGANIQLFFD